MSTLKKLAIEFLPRPLLMWGKKQYYAKVVPNFHEPEVDVIGEFVKSGDTALDLGANIGWYTCVLARLVGERGRVLAVEPIPDTFELLSSVVQKLRLGNVELHNCAVSEKDGSGVMELPRFDYGGTNFYMAHLVANKTTGDSMDTIVVPLRSLDAILSGQSLEKITFVKCDVEGHELSAIRGAAGLFSRCRPAMLIEVAGTAAIQDDPGNEFFTIMRGYGYEPYWYDGAKLRKRMPGHWSVNYFFLQPAHLKQVSHLFAN